jgi:hypothetical protein
VATEAKWTPRPWVFLEEGDAEALHNCRPLTICSPGKDDLAEVFSDEDSTVAIPREQAIANARLIAAAPDLYEALLGCVEHMEHSTPEGRVAYQIAKEVLASATPKAVRA